MPEHIKCAVNNNYFLNILSIKDNGDLTDFYILQNSVGHKTRKFYNDSSMHSQ